MPYIPEEHRKYNVLPRRREKGGEVFQYDPKLIWKAEELLGESITPYGFDSYQEYYDLIDAIAADHQSDPELLELLRNIKVSIEKLNSKEEWSICRFIGEPIGKAFGLTSGRAYYWPCTKESPIYNGVIDDEEFTSYWYPTEAKDWEILEDPTGMACRVILENAHHVTRKDFNRVMEQIGEELNR